MGRGKKKGKQDDNTGLGVVTKSLETTKITEKAEDVEAASTSQPSGGPSTSAEANPTDEPVMEGGLGLGGTSRKKRPKKKKEAVLTSTDPARQTYTGVTAVGCAASVTAISTVQSAPMSTAAQFSEGGVKSASMQAMTSGPPVSFPSQGMGGGRGWARQQPHQPMSHGHSPATAVVQPPEGVVKSASMQAMTSGPPVSFPSQGMGGGREWARQQPHQPMSPGHSPATAVVQPPEGVVKSASMQAMTSGPPTSFPSKQTGRGKGWAGRQPHQPMRPEHSVVETQTFTEQRSSGMVSSSHSAPQPTPMSTPSNAAKICVEPKSSSEQTKTLCRFQIPKKIIGRISPADRQITVLVNYLPMTIKASQIYRYDISFKPDRPKKFIPKAFYASKNMYFKNIDIAFDQKKNGYSLKKLPNVPENDRFLTNVEFEDDNNKKISFEVSYKFTGVVDLGTIIRYMQTGGTTLNQPTEAIQCVDVILRQGTLESYIKAGRQFFQRPREAINLGEGLEMWTGLYQSAIFTSRPFINIDVAHKGFPIHQPLLQAMSDFNNSHFLLLNLFFRGERYDHKELERKPKRLHIMDRMLQQSTMFFV
ncbi:hypothetical protein ACJJTC_004475 [Scirpophaga incertulas]